MSKAVTKTTAKPVADYGAYAGMGTNDITRDEVGIPFLKLLQQLSPEVEDEKGKAGQFFNTVTGEAFDRVVFQPCYRQHYFVEWVPQDDGGGYVGPHEPNSDVVQAAKKANGGQVYNLKHGSNDLIETRYVYGNILSDDGETVKGFAVVPFTSTKLKKLRGAMGSVWTTEGNPPLFAFRWVMTSKKEKDGQGRPYFNVEIAAKGLDLLPPGHDALKAGYEFAMTAEEQGQTLAENVGKASAAVTREPGEDEDTPF